MNVDLGIWDKLGKLITLLLVVAGLVAVAAWYLPVIEQNEKMRRQLHVLEGEIRSEEARARKLKSEVDAMRDPRTIERLARERLSFARSGETVIRFETSGTNVTASATRK